MYTGVTFSRTQCRTAKGENMLMLIYSNWWVWCCSRWCQSGLLNSLSNRDVSLTRGVATCFVLPFLVHFYLWELFIENVFIYLHAKRQLWMSTWLVERCIFFVHFVSLMSDCGSLGQDIRYPLAVQYVSRVCEEAIWPELFPCTIFSPALNVGSLHLLWGSARALFFLPT